MSTFVLVHGAWQSTGTWDLLIPLLTKHNHNVITPVLTGLGTDQGRLSAQITLTQHVSDVALTLPALPEKVVLVGHSYAGMIISGVAETKPSQISHLVFLDAFIPDDGQSVLDLLPSETGAYFRNVAREHGDGWRLPGAEGQLDLWGLKPGEARDFVRSKLCDFSLRCFEEPLSSCSRSQGQHTGYFRRLHRGRISGQAVLRAFCPQSACLWLGGCRAEDRSRLPCRTPRRGREHIALSRVISMSVTSSIDSFLAARRI